MALDHPAGPPAASRVGQASAPQGDLGAPRSELQKRATFALTFLAGVTFLYPSLVAVLLSAGIISSDVTLAYRALRVLGWMDQLGWLTDYWASLPAMLVGAAASITAEKRVPYTLAITFVAVAAFGSLWLGWLSDVPGSRIRGLFMEVNDVDMPMVLRAIDELKSLMDQTRDLAIVAISGGLGVVGATSARKQLRKRFS